MNRSRGSRAPAARSWLASLVLVVALVAYVGYSAVRLRRAMIPAASAPPAGSDGRHK
jgi:hypothetical protein